MKKIFFVLLPLLLLSTAISAQLDPQPAVVRTSSHDIFNERGMLSVRIVYSYDENGTVVYRTLYSYDSQLRITRRMQYTDTDFLILDDNFSYDKHGNLIGRKTKINDEWFGKNTFKERRKIKYDKEGNVIYRAYYLDGKLYFEDPPKSVKPSADEQSSPEVQPATQDDTQEVSPTAKPETKKAKPTKKQKNKKSKKRK